MKLSISGLTLISGLVLFSSNVEFALSTIKDLLKGAGSGYVLGVLEGESISFELWRKSEEKIEDIKIQTWIEGNNVYSVNGIAIAGNISTMVSGMGYELYPNVPNPFGASTSISFFTPERGEVMIGFTTC